MKKIYFILFFILIINSIYAQYYIREYTYRSSENDSEINARDNALRELKKLLIEEIGVYIKTETELSNNNNNIILNNYTRVISESITKVNIIDESWDGYFYYIKAKIYVNKKQIIQNLESIKNNQNSIKNNYNSQNVSQNNYIKSQLYGSIFCDYQPNVDFLSLGLMFGIIDNNLYNFGLYGMININYLNNNDIISNDKGILFGLIFFNNSIFSLSTSVKLGSGYLSYYLESDNFFVINPSIETSLNIKNFTISTGLGYRLTDDINITNKSQFLNGYNVFISLKFKN